MIAITVDEYILMIKTEGVETAQAKLATLERTKNELQNKKVNIQVELKNIDGLITKWKTAKKTLEEQKIQLKIDKASDQEIQRVTNDIKKASNEIKSLQDQRVRIINANDLKQTEGQLQKTNQEIRNIKSSLQQTGNTGQSAFAKMREAVYVFGAGLQSLGNAFQNIDQLNPFSDIVHSVEGLVGSGITNILTEGISGITDRYDAIKQYNIMMQAMGATEEETARMTKKLDESVQGLPTSLDEVMSMAKLFTATIGDWGKATDYAIAVNEAFLASGTPASAQYQGMQQINDLLSGKKLQTREWSSLIASMPLAVREAGKQLGYTGEKADQFFGVLRSNEITNEEFLNALVQATEKSEVLQNALEAQKNTFQGVFMNITTAIKRFGQQGLEEINKVFVAKTGGTLLANIGKVKDIIDDLGKSFRNWVKSHPDEIIGFFNKIKNIDWEGIIAGLGKVIKLKADLTLAFANVTSVIGPEAFAWITGLASGVGKVVSSIGGIFAGVARLTLPLEIFDKFKNVGKASKGLNEMNKIVSGVGTLSDNIDKVKVVNVGEKFARFKSFFMSLGEVAGVVALTAGIAGTLKLFASAIDDIAHIEVPNWKQALSVVGAMTASIAVVVGITKLVQSLRKATAPLKVLNGVFTAFDIGALVGEGLIAGLFGILDLVATTLRDWVKAINEISSVELPSAEKLDSVIQNVAILNGKLLLLAGEGGLGGVIKMAEFSDQMKSVANILGDMVKAVEYTHDLAKENVDKLKEEVEKLSAKGGLFDQVVDEMNKLKDRAVEFMNTFDTNKKEMVGGTDVTAYSKYKTGTTSTLPQFESQLQTVVAILESMKEYVAKIDAIKKEIEEKVLSIDDLKEGGSLQMLIEKLGEFMNQIKPQLAVIRNIGEDMGDFSADALNGVMDEIVTLIGKLETVNTTLTNSELFSDDDATNTLFSNLSNLLVKMQIILDNIATLNADDTTLEKIDIFNQALDKLKITFDKLALLKLPEKEEGENSVGDNLAVTISDMIGNLINALVRVDELKGQCDVLEEAISEVTSAISGATGINDNLVALQDTIGTTIGSLGTFRANIGYTKTDIDTLKTVVGELKDKINELPESKSIHIEVTGVESAISAVGRLATVISQLTDKTVNITQITRRQGGSVRRAIGGSITRYGTDSVQALLTPGEYVHKRSAVKKFGNRFMERVNNLDIKGAMKELSIRAGMGARTTNISRSNNISNKKINNNNAVVNQYITTNNPNWTYRRASRYARSL